MGPVLARALAKEREDRFASATELHEALAGALTAAPGRALASSAPTVAAAAGTPESS